MELSRGALYPTAVVFARPWPGYFLVMWMSTIGVAIQLYLQNFPLGLGSLILIFLVFFSPYLYYIPRASLSAVLICAVIFMIDWKTCVLLWKANNSKFIETYRQ